MSLSRQWLGLAVFIGICFAAAGVGAMLTASSVNGWYATLHKPSWNPPNEVSGPVWTILYLCMAIAAWLVWRRQGLAGAAIPLTIFAVQLTLNVAWSGLFFALHRIRFRCENKGCGMVECPQCRSLPRTPEHGATIPAR